MTNFLSPLMSKYRISRRGRKLQVSDDPRTILALPKEVPERTWAEILQKEENDLIVFDIREELLENALKIGYDRYMVKQNAPFQVHCTAQAWLKLIDWHFFRHDPGEEPSAYPPCFIPKRKESWVPDDLPSPSPEDSWCRQELAVIEDSTEEGLQRWPSNSSIDMPVINEIPKEYWFPGKVNWSGKNGSRDEVEKHTLPNTDSYDSSSGSLENQGPHDLSDVWTCVQVSETTSEDLAAESELVQCVTDYSTAEMSKKESSFSAAPKNTPLDGSLHGAGDSSVVKERRKRDKKSTGRMSVTGHTRGALPPLALDTESRSRASVISDCRLRNLRLETQYDISPEKLDTPPCEPINRK